MLAGAGVWLFGLPAVLSFNTLADWHPLESIAALEGKNVFALYDFLVTSVLLPLNALLIALFTGWAIGTRTVGDALGIGSGLRYKLWRVLLRFAIPLAIAWVWLTALR